MRTALWCRECGWRSFGDTRARCPKHPRKTVVQANLPYFGRKLEQPEAKGLDVVDARTGAKYRG